MDIDEFYKEQIKERNRPFIENKNVEPVIDYDLKKLINDTTDLFDSIHILKDHIDFYKILIERLKIIGTKAYIKNDWFLVYTLDVYTFNAIRRPLIRMINDNLKEQYTECIRHKRTAKKIIELIEKMIVKLNVKYEELYKSNTEKRIETKREFGNTKVTCDHCNKEYTKANKARHLKQCKIIKEL